MPNEIYPISHFGKSTDDGFGSIYHHYTNAIEQPIVVVPPIGVVPAEPILVVPLEPVVVVPIEPEEPTKPIKKK